MHWKACNYYQLSFSSKIFHHSAVGNVGASLAKKMLEFLTPQNVGILGASVSDKLERTIKYSLRCYLLIWSDVKPLVPIGIYKKRSTVCTDNDDVVAVTLNYPRIARVGTSAILMCID